MSSHKGDSTSPATSDSEEKGEPNPNIHRMFEEQEEEKPNIMTFEPTKKKMFESDSDSDQEPPPVEKPNEERPDTNWLQSSSGDEDIQSYMKNIEDRFKELSKFADTPQKETPKKPERVPKFKPVSKPKKVHEPHIPQKPEKPPPDSDSGSDSDVVCLTPEKEPQEDPDGNPIGTEYDVKSCLGMRTNPETGKLEFLIHFEADGKTRIDWWTPFKGTINCQRVVTDFLEAQMVFMKKNGREPTPDEVEAQINANWERIEKERADLQKRKKKAQKKSQSSEYSEEEEEEESSSEDDDEEFKPSKDSKISGHRIFRW